MLSSKEIKDLLPWRTRGIGELERRVGKILPLIDALLKTKKKVRILEIGCGFGTCLIELRKRYGMAVALVGINKKLSHGDWAMMMRVARTTKSVAAGELKRMHPPKIVFCDVSEGLPFKSGTFDIIYSQVAFQYFDDKIKVIEEIDRVLAKGGIAKMHTMLSDGNFPQGYRDVIEIWDARKGKQVALSAYLRNFPSVRLKRSSAKKRYLTIRKGPWPGLDLRLALISTTNVNLLDKSCWGTKSVYSIRQ